jgi:hypothetical protein
MGESGSELSCCGLTPAVLILSVLRAWIWWLGKTACSLFMTLSTQPKEKHSAPFDPVQGGRPGSEITGLGRLSVVEWFKSLHLPESGLWLFVSFITLCGSHPAHA